MQYSETSGTKMTLNTGKTNFVNKKFTNFVSGSVNGKITLGESVDGSYFDFISEISGTLTVYISLNASKGFYVVDKGLNLVDYSYNLPIKAGNASQTFTTNDKGESILAAKSYGSVTFNMKPGESYKVLCTGSKLGFFGFDFIASLTTAASGFSTLSMPFAVDYKSLGLTAYAIGLDESAMKVTYKEIDGIVPANTPVLVKGEASKTYSLTKATGDVAEVTTSLQVSDGKVVTEGGHYYAFSTVDGKSGFKKLADGITIPAKKGYLKLATANAKGFFAFDDETTGIKGIVNGTIEEEETPLYNLAGQRVSKDYKGVIVKNGKKFFNK